jgi:hypothetical protein
MMAQPSRQVKPSVALIRIAAVIVLIDSVRRWIGGRRQTELPADPALAEA